MSIRGGTPADDKLGRRCLIQWGWIFFAWDAQIWRHVQNIVTCKGESIVKRTKKHCSLNGSNNCLRKGNSNCFKEAWFTELLDMFLSNLFNSGHCDDFMPFAMYFVSMIVDFVCVTIDFVCVTVTTSA